jgi:Protein of unknown function (DUF1302)
MSGPRAIAVLTLLILAGAQPSPAQNLPKGYVSLFADYFPNHADALELRARLFAEETFDPSPRVRINASGFVEGLVARRPNTGGVLETVTDGIFRVHDLNVAFSHGRFDVLAGYARVTWGKLDEIQPTDVINPLDVSRFFFEGRSEARLPVLVLRGRLHLSEAVTIEGIYLPDFRRGRFDQLDESSSPFNIATRVTPNPVACLAIGCPMPVASVSDREPAFTAGNAQGGSRISATTGRVDWSVSAFRGFESFGLIALEASPAQPGLPLAALALVYPRFTMIGGDFELVRGEWGVRGELAAFVEDSFQSADPTLVSGSSIDAGVGVDRRAGDFTLSGTVLLHSESYDEPLSPADPRTGRSDVSVVVSADRTFARERYRLRGFGVYNATEASGFIRGIAMTSLRDNLGLEASVGWFLGDGRDLVGRFADSDFVYVRLKYHF